MECKAAPTGRISGGGAADRTHDSASPALKPGWEKPGAAGRWLRLCAEVVSADHVRRCASQRRENAMQRNALRLWQSCHAPGWSGGHRSGPRKGWRGGVSSTAQPCILGHRCFTRASGGRCAMTSSTSEASAVSAPGGRAPGWGCFTGRRGPTQPAAAGARESRERSWMGVWVAGFPDGGSRAASQSG
jgi:hypothetical protein